MKITLAQLNPVVGDINGNLKKIKNTLSTFHSGSDLVVFPELFLTGYPPRDLLEKSWFINKVQEVIREIKVISEEYRETGIIIGVPFPTNKKTGRGLYNSALFFYKGELILRQDKSLLPTYDVFDEARYFDMADEIKTVLFKGETLGISICEDMWNVKELWQQQRYSVNPIKRLAEKEATVMINISASPFNIGKDKTRFKIIKRHVLKYQMPFIFVNQIGGNDELIFDGTSMIVDKTGRTIDTLASFQEDVRTIDLKEERKSIGPESDKKIYKSLDKIESIYNALLLGIKDYMNKCGFEKAIIGLSGGIDSAVTCSLARDALGSKNVFAVTMPGPYSSKGSVEDSKILAKNLDIDIKVIPISGVYEAYLESLQEHFAETETGVAEENIQARIRGNIVMAFSNKFDYLVLTTGNKSELAVGYCTLYGDMSGGLGVISDVPKTMVYKLADYINRNHDIIPDNIIDKPPSAELKPDQKDEDTLPPYEVLDQVLHYYVDEGYSLEKIVNLNFEREMVKRVIRLVDRNEYKRRQAAPGLKVTTKAFGIGRRMPIAAKFNG